MARYVVKCEECGNEFKVELFGKNKTREWLLQRNYWICESCKADNKIIQDFGEEKGKKIIAILRKLLKGIDYEYATYSVWTKKGYRVYFNDYKGRRIFMFDIQNNIYMGAKNEERYKQIEEIWKIAEK